MLRPVDENGIILLEAISIITFLLWLLCTLGSLSIAVDSTSTPAFVGYLLIVNAAGLVMMHEDKKRAVQQRANRIPEKMLFRITAIGGGIGTIFAMHRFRHKTKHRKFVYLLPLMTVPQYLIIVFRMMTGP